MTKEIVCLPEDEDGEGRGMEAMEKGFRGKNGKGEDLGSLIYMC